MFTQSTVGTFCTVLLACVALSQGCGQQRNHSGIGPNPFTDAGTAAPDSGMLDAGPARLDYTWDWGMQIGSWGTHAYIMDVVAVPGGLIAVGSSEGVPVPIGAAMLGAGRTGGYAAYIARLDTSGALVAGDTYEPTEWGSGGRN